MNKTKKIEWYILLITGALTVFYCWDISKVPFHPDESTQIFMSQDYSILLRNPLSLAWESGQKLTPEARYRAIDAPLTRYLIGASRALFSIPPLSTDWDWSTNWKKNVDSGAYPDSKQLSISRTAVSLLLPASLLFYYLSVRTILPKISSLIALLLLGLHPLLLLHARRAMAESALLFGITFFLWVATRKNCRPWLLGLALAVSFNAKQSALALFPVGIIVLCLLPKYKDFLIKKLVRITEFTITFLLITYLLNPFFWKKPIQAIRASYQERSSFSMRQMEEHLGNLGQDRQSISFQLLAEVINTYISPPITEEVGNYLDATEASKVTYFSFLPHSWGRGFIPGSIFLTLSISGIVVVSKRFTSFSSHQKNTLMIFILATLSLSIFILTFLPWQRYVIPLLPLTVFWISVGLLPLTEVIFKHLASLYEN